MSADCSLQVVESQHRSGDLILANDKFRNHGIHILAHSFHFLDISASLCLLFDIPPPFLNPKSYLLLCGFKGAGHHDE
jgi:hypothetical protein